MRRIVISAASLVAAGKTVSAVATPHVAVLVEAVGARAKLALFVILAAIIGGTLGLVSSEQPAAIPKQSSNEAKSNAALPIADLRNAKADHYGDPLPEGAVARLGTVRLRHPSVMVPLLAFLPDGKLLTSGDDGMVRVWNPATGKELRNRPGREDRGWTRGGGMALSADGKLLATADSKAIYLHKPTNRKELQRIPLETAPSSDREMAVSPDGKVLAAALGRQPVARGKTACPIGLWDKETGMKLRIIEGLENDPVSIVFTPDGRSLIATSAYSQTVFFWDPVTGKEQRRLDLQKRDQVSCLALSTDGKILAVGGSRFAPPTREATIWLWDRASGNELRRLTAGGSQVSSVALSPDGKILASLDDEEFRLWDVATGKELRRIDARKRMKTRIAFAPDGKIVATSTYQTIRLWDVATGKELGKREAHTGNINGIAYSPDGKLVASASQEIRIWDAGTGKPLRALHGHDALWYVRAVAFTPDGKQLVSGGGDNTIRVWDVATEKEVRVIKILPEHNPDRDKWGGQVMAMRLSSDGRIVYAVSEQVGVGGPSKWLLSAWAVGSGKLLFQREEQPGCPYSVFSPDGQRVVTVRSVRDIAVPAVTDTVTGKLICSLPGVERLYFVPAFSPDSKLLAVLCFSGPQGCNARPMAPGDPSKGSHVHIFELATGTELRAWTVPDSVTCLAFSPDNRVLASSSRDTIRFWSFATGKELSQRSAHDVEANSLLFAPDGQTLAAALQDSTVLIWGSASGTRDAAMPAKELRPSDLTALWVDLGSPDAAKGQAAVWALAAAPRDSVPFLAKHLRPAVLPDNEQLTRSIADLDSVVFADREKASRELERQGELAESRLRKALEDNPSPEMRRRIEALLNKLQGPLTSPESLPSIRAIEVLEHIGSREARQLLQKLADGAAEARQTREAKAALQRLERLNPR